MAQKQHIPEIILRRPVVGDLLRSPRSKQHKFMQREEIPDGGAVVYHYTCCQSAARSNEVWLLEALPRSSAQKDRNEHHYTCTPSTQNPTVDAVRRGEGSEPDFYMATRACNGQQLRGGCPRRTDNGRRGRQALMAHA